jgi:cyclopropane fatty-acyl-phospholipid synthase-like methyltransferase
MTGSVEQHYGVDSGLSERIATRFQASGKKLAELTSADLGAIDEFHIRGRKATLELAERMEIDGGSRVLDVGSGLGGPARTLAQAYRCDVMGIDLTAAFCAAATEMSRWVGVSDRVSFKQGDATAMELDEHGFDAAMTLHVGMNIENKDAVYAGVHWALKVGRIFAIYDVLQGDGGAVHFPVPWARDPSISHLATPDEMRALLIRAGFSVECEIDSTDESEAWFREKAARMGQSQLAAIGFQILLGDDYDQMARNQVRNLAERRIRTVTYVARSR